MHFDHCVPNFIVILLHQVVSSTAHLSALSLSGTEALIKFVNGMYALSKVIVVFFSEHAVDQACEDARGDIALVIVVGRRQVPMDVRVAPVAFWEQCFDQLFSCLFVLLVIKQRGNVSIRVERTLDVGSCRRRPHPVPHDSEILRVVHLHRKFNIVLCNICESTQRPQEITIIIRIKVLHHSNLI